MKLTSECLFPCVCMLVCLCAWLSVCVHTCCVVVVVCVCVCVRACVHACVHACVSMCLSVCMYMWVMYVQCIYLNITVYSINHLILLLQVYPSNGEHCSESKRCEVWS